MKWAALGALVLLVSGCGDGSRSQPPPLQRYEALRGLMSRVSGLDTSLSRTKSGWDREVGAGEVAAVRADASRLATLSHELENSSAQLRPEVLDVALADANRDQHRFLQMVGGIAALEWSEAQAIERESHLIWSDPLLLSAGTMKKALAADRSGRRFAWLAYLEARRAAAFHALHRRAFRFQPVESGTPAPALGRFVPDFS